MATSYSTRVLAPATRADIWRILISSAVGFVSGTAFVSPSTTTATSRLYSPMATSPSPSVFGFRGFASQAASVSNGVHSQEKLANVSRLDEAERHCSLEILPILFEKASFPFQSSSARDSCEFLSSEELDNSPDCDPRLAFLSFLEVTHPTKSRMSLETSDTRLTCQNVIDIHVNGGDAYSSCIVNIDIDKDKLKTSKSYEGTFESLKTESTLVRIEKVLQRQSSLKMGAKLVQYLLDHGLMLLKFSPKEKSGTERVHDTPNNRWRKYKRAASFDSRKIVILFSILSSLGTLILIYLTLRVRQQSGDGSVAM